MVDKYRRASTRSQVWPDTEAIVEITDPMSASGRGKLRVRGNVKDLGSYGMFFETQEYIPSNVEVEVEIIFDPNSRVSNLLIKAIGKTVRRTSEGIGIKFTKIDLSRLQRCIMEKMNRQDKISLTMYTLSENESGSKN
mgnify:CR=1 FL=1